MIVRVLRSGRGGVAFGVGVWTMDGGYNYHNQELTIHIEVGKLGLVYLCHFAASERTVYQPCTYRVRTDRIAGS